MMNEEKNKHKELMKAILDNNVERVRVILNEGVDINQAADEEMVRMIDTKGGLRQVSGYYDQYRNEYTALRLAVRKGCNEIVEVLLNNGAKICGDELVYVCNKKYVTNATKHTELAKLLIKHDANIHATNPITPLAAASMVGNVEIVKILLQYGVDIDALSHNIFCRFQSYTALMYAVENERKEHAMNFGMDYKSAIVGYDRATFREPGVSVYVSLKAELDTIKILCEHGACITLNEYSDTLVSPPYPQRSNSIQHYHAASARYLEACDIKKIALAFKGNKSVHSAIFQAKHKEFEAYYKGFLANKHLQDNPDSKEAFKIHCDSLYTHINNTKEQKEKSYVFLEGKHPRLGADSPCQGLTKDTLEIIIKKLNIHDADYELSEQIAGECGIHFDGFIG